MSGVPGSFCVSLVREDPPTYLRWTCDFQISRLYTVQTCLWIEWRYYWMLDRCWNPLLETGEWKQPDVKCCSYYTCGVCVSPHEVTVSRTYLVTLQVTVLAHPKQTSMFHRFLRPQPLQEMHHWALLLPPHQLRTWAKPPLGSPTSLIASMVRKTLCTRKFSSPFLLGVISVHLLALTVLWVLLDWVNTSWSQTSGACSRNHLAWTAPHAYMLVAYMNPSRICQEDAAEVPPHPGVFSRHWAVDW